MKILTIGGATRDIFIEHNVQATTINNVACIIFPEGKKVEISALHYTTGGGATNSAFSFATLGFQAECFCKVGTDYEGEIVLDELAKHGIGIDHAARTNLATTGTSFILPSPSGDRAILVYRGANTLLSQDDIPQDLLSGIERLYITSLSDGASHILPHIAQTAHQKNIPVACNPGTSQLTAEINTLKQALPFIKILILNAFEASLFMQTEPFALKNPDGNISKSLHAYFQEVLSQGPAIAVVTNGADGVYVADGKSVYYHPSIQIKAVSSVGAGDAFGSTFVAYLAHNSTIEEAIRAGIINAASVLMHVGAKAGLLNQEEIKKQRMNLDSSLLKIVAM